MNILIGNGLCLAGSVIMTLMGLIKDKKKFLMTYSGMNIFFIAGNLFLGGVSGAIANFVTMLRNLYCVKKNITPAVKVIFIAAQILLTAFFGVEGLLMWLPVLGICFFTWFIDTDNMILLKLIIIFGQLVWLVYDLSMLNYTTAVFDVTSCITNSIALAGLAKQKRQAAQSRNAASSGTVLK